MYKNVEKNVMMKTWSQNAYHRFIDMLITRSILSTMNRGNIGSLLLGCILGAKVCQEWGSI